MSDPYRMGYDAGYEAGRHVAEATENKQKAALDLYEALHAAILQMGTRHTATCKTASVNLVNSTPEQYQAVCTCWVKKAKNALAKADGEQP